MCIYKYVCGSSHWGCFLETGIPDKYMGPRIMPVGWLTIQ